MSQDYTVAKELASLKEIKQSAEQRISDLSLNALNYVNDHRLHKAGGGGESSDIPYDIIIEYDTDIDDGETMKIIKHPSDLPADTTTFNMALYEPDKNIYYPCVLAPDVDGVSGMILAHYVFKGRDSGDCRRELYYWFSEVIPPSWDQISIKYGTYAIIGDNNN